MKYSVVDINGFTVEEGVVVGFGEYFTDETNETLAYEVVGWRENGHMVVLEEIEDYHKDGQTGQWVWKRTGRKIETSPLKIGAI